MSLENQEGLEKCLLSVSLTSWAKVTMTKMKMKKKEKKVEGGEKVEEGEGTGGSSR